ncbi:MAG TPA: formylmethanofuran dehydrogenase subunit E family protein [Thermoguttaceae bacterium]
MLRSIMLFCLFGFTTTCFSADIIEGLPLPHYHPQGSDPAWLRYAVQLHGHLGPMLTFGARMGMGALNAVDAKGYFDVEITCEGPFAAPPASCFLDGIQIATGATLGKRNLKWIENNQIIVHIKNTRSGKTAQLQPKDQFLALLPQPNSAPAQATQRNQKSQPGDDHQYDGLAREIAAMPEKEILEITYP